MPSPKSGTAGNLISPVPPRDALEAGNADPGLAEPQYKTDPLKKHKIEIVLFTDEGKPAAGESYKIVLSDGSSVASGTLDENGCAKVTGIDPGTCKVMFPNLEDDQWE